MLRERLNYTELQKTHKRSITKKRMKEIYINYLIFVKDFLNWHRSIHVAKKTFLAAVYIEIYIFVSKGVKKTVQRNELREILYFRSKIIVLLLELPSIQWDLRVRLPSSELSLKINRHTIWKEHKWKVQNINKNKMEPYYTDT